MAQEQSRTGTTVATMETRRNPRPVRFDAPLPGVPRGVEVVAFAGETLGTVREHVSALGDRAGLAADRLDDLVLAVHEIATNSVRHGGGRGELRAWLERGRVVCDVRDAGWIPDLDSVAHRPTPTAAVCGRGLWMAKQLCDRMQIRSTRDGTVVRLQQKVG
jgi:anti-sigma regulatory factor (Ser/Thr protein kinase)